MGDEVKTSMGMTFRAWNAPNYATLILPARDKGEGMAALPTFPVVDLDPAALDALAGQWLDHLYAKAGRASPFVNTDKPHGD